MFQGLGRGGGSERKGGKSLARALAENVWQAVSSREPISCFQVLSDWNVRRAQAAL